MDHHDIFVWPDGSWLYRDDYSDEFDRWRGDDYEVLYVGTPDYHDFLDIREE